MISEAHTFHNQGGNLTRTIIASYVSMRIISENEESTADTVHVLKRANVDCGQSTELWMRQVCCPIHFEWCIEFA
jgi:hypothetical protein